MTETLSPPARRKLWLASIDDAVAEINRLRTDGYTRRGNWSLSQICSHLRRTIEDNLSPPATDVATPDEIATREKFFAMAMNPDGMPANLPLPADRTPAADTPDGEIDGLITALKNLKTYAHKCVKIGRCGPVPIDQVIALHLAHASHHLSFLEPKPAGGITPDGRPRRLRFKTDSELKAEVQNLRKTPHDKTGNWNLHQIARHLAIPIEMCLNSPVDSTTPTPEQAATQTAVLEPYFATGGPAPGFHTPAPLLPGDDCTDADIERFINALEKLSADERPVLMFGPFGPIPADRCREFHLIHAAHHLSFLKPKKRRKLNYADEAAVIADVTNLRRGHVRHGSWSLAQNCWHLTQGVKARMAPCPNPILPNSPEQDARKPIFDQVLATGELPPGLPAPDAMLPPADAGDEAIDGFIAVLKEFSVFPGPIPPHRLFGHLPDPVARRVNLMHCANHLSNLEPTTVSTGPQLKKQADYRKLRFADVDAALAEVGQLRKGCRPSGNWTLPMVARHITLVTGNGPRKPADPTPTPEQAARKKAFVDVALATGRPPAGFVPPVEMIPPGDCDDTDVDRLEQFLRDLAAYPHPAVAMGPFGPVKIEEYRTMQLTHLAHHLGFLIPL